MQPREQKDATTVAIGRALGIFVVVACLGTAVLYLADRLGVDETAPAFVVVVAVAALLSVAFLVRHRDG